MHTHRNHAHPHSPAGGGGPGHFKHAHPHGRHAPKAGAPPHPDSPAAKPAAGPQLDAAYRKFLELHALPGGLTAPLLRQAMHVTEAVAETWIAPLNTACRKYEIFGTVRRTAAFLGHIAHESGNLRKLEENLNYTDPQRINKLFKAIKTDQEAQAYVRKPEALANKIYADKLGNGDTASGDGWRYRGRGLIQLTGKSNYRAFGKDAGVDAVNSPELLATPAYAALSAAWFWQTKGLNELADAQMYQKLSLRINKSLTSFPEREAKRKQALDALCNAILTNMALSAVSGAFGGWY